MADDNASASDPSSSKGSLQNSLSDTVPNTQQTTESASQPNGNTEDATLDTLPDRDIDAEINPQSSTDTMNVDSTNGVPASTAQTAGADSADPHSIPAVVEPRIPQKKDTSLREFLGKMDDYAPLIPDAVTDYYLTLAGLPPPPETDRKLARLLALATQKFIADIAADAYQYSRIRSTNTTSNNPMSGLGGAAGFGVNASGESEGAGKGKKDAAKAAPLGGPRPGYGGGGAGSGQGRTVLTMEDLGMAVGEYGVNVKRGEFYR